VSLLFATRENKHLTTSFQVEMTLSTKQLERCPLRYIFTTISYVRDCCSHCHILASDQQLGTTTFLQIMRCVVIDW